MRSYIRLTLPVLLALSSMTCGDSSTAPHAVIGGFAFVSSFNDRYASGSILPIVVQLVDTAGQPVAVAGVTALISRSFPPANPSQQRPACTRFDRLSFSGSGHLHGPAYPDDPNLTGDTVAVTDNAGRATFSGVAVAGAVGRVFAVAVYGIPQVHQLPTTTSRLMCLSPGPVYAVAAVYDTVHQATGRKVRDLPIAIITDSVGNPVPGTPVTLAIGLGGGTLDSTQLIANDSGVVRLNMWTLGATSGLNTVTATIADANGPSTATLVAVGHQAGSLRVGKVPTALQDSTISPDSVMVSVMDSSQTWVLNDSGFKVTPGVTLASGRSVPPPKLIGDTSSVMTGSDGVARFGGLGIHGQVGSSAALVFSGTQVAPGTSAPIRMAAGPAAMVTAVGQPGLLPLDTIGTPEHTVAVQVSDAKGNPVYGATVRFGLIHGSTSSCRFPDTDANTDSVTTDLAGQASVDIQLPLNATSCRVQAIGFNLDGYQIDEGLTYSEIVAPAGATVWMGTADSNWTNAANWTAGVPTQTSTVFIPVATSIFWDNFNKGFTPGLQANTNIGTLMLDGGSYLNLHGDTLRVFGDVNPESAYAGGLRSADSGVVMMMSAGRTLGGAVNGAAGTMVIGDPSSACAGAQPIQSVNFVSVRQLDVNCPFTFSTSGFEVDGDLNVQHHGTMAIPGPGTVKVVGNVRVTSDQSSEGLLTGGLLLINYGNFTQDTVAGAPASYRNFYSTGTSLEMASPEHVAHKTISATSDQIQIWDLTIDDYNTLTDSASVTLSDSGIHTYTILHQLEIHSTTVPEVFTIPEGITLYILGLTMSGTTQMVVNGTLQVDGSCSFTPPATLVVGPAGSTPETCRSYPSGSPRRDYP